MNIPEIPENPKELDYYTDLPVGEIIRRTRKSYGKSLLDVEKALRIRAQMLEAIEKGDIEKLPGRVYAIGFVRSYAEYLNLDGDIIVHLFKIQSVGARPRPEVNMPAPVDDSKIPNIVTSIISTLLAFSLIIFWVTYNQSKNQEERFIPEVPEELSKNDLTLEIITQDPEQDIETINPETMKPAVTIFNGPEIAISVNENSWVQIKNANGKTILSKVLKKGQYYSVPDEEGLVMNTGNAGGISIILNGKSLKPLGKKAEVVKNIPLNIEYLEQYKEND